MKTRTKIILAVCATSFIIGGTLMVQMKTPFDIFLTKDFTGMKAKRLEYLKAHEAEMTEYIKSQNARIESVQYDWDSIEVGTIGNGTPQGAGKRLNLLGTFNGIKDSSFHVMMDVKKDGMLEISTLQLGDNFRIGVKVYE